MAVKTRSILAITSEVTATVRSVYDIIVAYDAANGTALIADNGSTCLWWGVQNKDASVSLYNQSDNATSGNGNIEIAAGTYRQFPSDDAKYELRQEFIRVGTNNQVFALDIKWG